MKQHNQALRRAHTVRNAQPLRFPLEVGIPGRAADELRCCLPRAHAFPGGSVHGLVSRTRPAQGVGRRRSTRPRTCRCTAPLSFAPSIASDRCSAAPPRSTPACRRKGCQWSLAAHSADVPAAGTARGSGWGRGARSSETPRSPRGERRPLRPPNAWPEASLAGGRGSRGGPRAGTSARTCARSRVRPRVRPRALLRPRTRARPRREAARENARDIVRDIAAKSRDIARDLASRPAREIASRPAREIARGNGPIPRRDSRGIPARLTYPPRLSFVSHLPTYGADRLCEEGSASVH